MVYSRSKYAWNDAAPFYGENVFRRTAQLFSLYNLGKLCNSKTMNQAHRERTNGTFQGDDRLKKHSALMLRLLSAFLLTQLIAAPADSFAQSRFNDGNELKSAAHRSASKPFHFGFKRSQNGELPSIDQEGFKDIIEKNEAIFLGDTSRKVLYLTFDNGYENDNLTARILDVLKEKKVPATFFVTGHYVKDQPELLKRMAAEGHIIGNHSWSHPDLTQKSNEQIREELEKVKAEVTRVTGQQHMSYLRPPRGIFDARTLAVTKDLGYTNVFWSIAYKDWEINAQKGAAYAREQVAKQLHPGAVILLHAVSRDNAEALVQIIDDARQQGYEFEALTQLRMKDIPLP